MHLFFKHKKNDQQNHCMLWLFFCHSLCQSCTTVGGAQAWASAGQPTLADRRKWPTPTATRTGPTRQPLALMRHHKGLQVTNMPLLQYTSVPFMCGWSSIFHWICWNETLSSPQGDFKRLFSFLCESWFFLILFLCAASSSVAGAVGMTTSGESESDDSEMGRLQGKWILC